MKKTILVFSALIVALLALFQLGKYSFIAGNTSIEFLIATIALVFLVIGFYLNRKNSKNISENSEPDHSKIKELGIIPVQHYKTIKLSV